MEHQSGDLLLDGTDSSSTDAGDKVLLDGTDGGSDSGDNVDLEDGSSSYAVLSLPTRSEFSGGTDDYAVTAGELETAYDRFEDTESLDINLVLGGRGGGCWRYTIISRYSCNNVNKLCRKEKRLCCICITLSVLQQLV